MSEDSIFIVYVEHLLMHSRLKILPRTRLHCLFFMYVSFGEEKKDENAANATLIYSCLCVLY